jgi:glutamine cyclotransferase
MRSLLDIEKLFLILLITLFSSAGCDLLYAQKPAGNQKATKYRVKVTASFPHNVNSYTQGLFFFEKQMYESAGRYGFSKFMKVDLKSGNSLSSISFPEKYFAEGSVSLNGKVYILTWRERVVFVYDIYNFKPVKTLFNPKEGWGLTTDGKELVMSDGTGYLYFMDPDYFKERRSVEVKLDGKKVSQLNELEYINGDIWANVYGEDVIYIINPANGRVKGVVDCRNLLPAGKRSSDPDVVLNGIAYEPESGKIYLTGKLWPLIYQVELVK